GFKQGIKTNAAFSCVITGGSNAVQYTPKFAYVAAPGASAASEGTVSTYALAPDGTLESSLASSGTSPSPFSLSSVPWGSNLLLASPPVGMAYELSATTGVPVPPVFFGNATRTGGVIIDPSEQWAFETDT